MQNSRSSLADSPSSPFFVFVFFQKKKEGRITFDTMDFVAESVCIESSDLLLGIFFFCLIVSEKLWAGCQDCWVQIKFCYQPSVPSRASHLASSPMK